MIGPPAGRTPTSREGLLVTTTQETGRHIALVDIRVPDNVRDLDRDHVKALAGEHRADPGG